MKDMISGKMVLDELNSWLSDAFSEGEGPRIETIQEMIEMVKGLPGYGEY